MKNIPLSICVAFVVFLFLLHFPVSSIALEIGTNTYSHSRPDNVAFINQENGMINTSFEWGMTLFFVVDFFANIIINSTFFANFFNILIHTVREWVYWNEIESQDGTFSWISYDVAFYQFSISNIKAWLQIDVIIFFHLLFCHSTWRPWPT